MAKSKKANSNGSFSEAEKKAMRARAKELKAEARAAAKREEGEKVLLEAIKEMPKEEKAMATRIHELVSETAPHLWPKTWYGMPAYKDGKDGKVILYFQAATKFESRYSTFGFNDTANLDDGNMWPTSFALVKLTEKEEKEIVKLVKKAVK